ncbi:cell division protein FtsK [Salmonella enterica subsp. enterica]|uniref:Cell division protein FtsK n=1 Tax=Salmonella enterica I TaxID=59201 RepID=A0A3S4GK65_SALET|nr:cell division protein FtsK [Salmonella enterica subsp. enterica]
MAALAAGTAAAAPAFGLATGGAPRPQVKEGIGPQLPRPNRVRVPTRRELASYGIKLPSQRIAEEKAREAERNQYETGAQLTDEENRCNASGRVSPSVCAVAAASLW